MTTYNLLPKKYNWVIDKEFHFEMGHRVWAQELNNPELSISTACACKHLHGHSYVIKVFLGADKLDQSAMVTDFKNINFMKEFVDDRLDHKFMIDVNDPNFELITNVKNRGDKVTDFDPLSKYIDDYDSLSDDEKLHIDGFVLVNFVPTSENLCKHIWEYAHDKIGGVFKDVDVTAVELWETKKSHCRYEP